MFYHLCFILVLYPPPTMGHILLSIVIRLGEVAYYMDSTSVVSTEPETPTFGSGQIAEPCTLVTVNSTDTIADQIRNSFDLFNSSDDVWSTRFTQTVVLQMDGPKISITPEVKNALRHIGVTEVHVFYPSDDRPHLPQGPYFLQDGRLHLSYRLYPDTVDAFVVATIPADDNDTSVFEP